MVCRTSPLSALFFFFNDTATTEIYTLSLHDALPICETKNLWCSYHLFFSGDNFDFFGGCCNPLFSDCRSEEHTSELQSQSNIVCRLLLEKNKPRLIIDHHVQQSS